MSTDHTELIRTGAAAAAVVLAVLSRGDLLVLAGLLAVVAWRPAALALVPACLASAWRWGASSLDALAGAQAVLGPAGLVGPGAGAASSWVVAATIVLASPAERPARPAPHAPAAPGRGSARRSEGVRQLVDRWLRPLAFGAAAADVVAGPALGGQWWTRVVATIVAAGLAAAASRVRVGRARALDAAVLAGALLALVLVASVATPWSGTVDTSAVATGAAVAAAVVLATAVGERTLAAMRDRGA